MNSEKEQFFSRERLPSRLTAIEAAWLINCQECHLWMLIRAGLLTPLGNPSQNSSKFFATATLQEKLVDVEWNSKVTACISDYWAARKAARRPQLKKPAIYGRGARRRRSVS